MRLAEYEALLKKLCSSRYLRNYRQVLGVLPNLNMDQRSAVAKLCRAQCYPPRSSRLHKMTTSLPHSFKVQILPLCQTAPMAGLILQLILLAPMSTIEIDHIYRASFQKEMIVMESVKRTCTLDFSPFFGAYDLPIHDHFPPNAVMARRIHKGIDRWITTLESKILYPRMSSKTISKMTSDNLHSTIPDYVAKDSVGITTIDLEAVYHTHGVRISGPCEMRQKWYCSNLKPRTYYSQGGDAYHTSKYLANPFTELCDTLPCTNRRLRTDPTRIVIPDGTHDVILYDLTSFTSNLHVHSDFMMQLSRYCNGRQVTILDTVHGLVQQDLGDMIYEYTKVNLDKPTYTLPSKYSDSSVTHYHNIAGFLGVYGNIATATFIHGITMSMLHDNTNENNVAGDDGLESSENVGRSLKLLEALGEISEEKTFRVSEGCCIHLKRPITRIGDRLIPGQLVTWPTLEHVQDNTDLRYPYLKRLSKRERTGAISGSITAFLRSLESQPLDTNDIEIIDTLLTYIYDEYELPREGCVPQAAHNATTGFVPAYERRYIGIEPISNTICRNYTNIARVPLRDVVKMEWYMLSDEVFRCNQNALLSLLERLGYVSSEKPCVYVYGEEGMKRLLKEYARPDPRVYDYTVVGTLPDWVSDLEALNSK